MSQFVVSQSDNQEDHNKNDSITRKISVHTENIINLLIESYGKAPTDTILKILGNLDNSGYIPIELYEKLNEEDFSTEIGKGARKAYQKYLKAKDDKVHALKTINLRDEKLSLIRIIENDTIILRDLLLEHKGYKILDFWATWCAPCRSFNKRFQNHYSEYKDKGIEFYGIGIRIDSETEKDKFLTAIKHDKTPWKQFIDLNNETYNLFGTNSVPYQVLLDEKNQVIKILSHDIHNELDDLLKN
ncbi:TlpA family protein disulfide reductase [Winogradskyella sp.]|uniref:TlpA family protein disulfide reductase n=1 Tax=Winogradskyella sp. TaxID=1883156 RepID=UPI003BAB22B8